MNRKLKKGPLIILVLLVCAVLFFVIRTVTKKPAEEGVKPENTAESTPAETAPSETPEPAETEPEETTEPSSDNEEKKGSQGQAADEDVVIEIEEDSGFIIE